MGGDYEKFNILKCASEGIRSDGSIKSQYACDTPCANSSNGKPVGRYEFCNGISPGKQSTMTYNSGHPPGIERGERLLSCAEKTRCVSGHNHSEDSLVLQNNPVGG